jgi:hypothetical protein
VIAYKFLQPGRVAPFGGITWPEPGEWFEVESVDPCRSGVHACGATDLPYWLGLGELWEVELDEVAVDERKLVAGRGRLLRQVEGWDEETRRGFVAACAERARPRADEAPDVAPQALAVRGMTPQAAGFISARVAEVAGGAAAYEAERRAQAEWLIDALGLEAG